MLLAIVLTIVIEFGIPDKYAAIWTSNSLQLLIDGNGLLLAIDMGFPHIFRTNCLLFKA